VDHGEVQVGDAALAPAGGNVAPTRHDVTSAALPVAPSAGRWARFLDGDV
jgi:hypothetical protein